MSAITLFRIRFIIGFSTVALLLIVQTVSFTQTASTETLPGWFAENMAFLTKGSARWVADNSAYKSKDEPVDAYAIEYTWGVGKKNLKSRLFAISNKKESGSMWEYTHFWHPGEKKVFIYQYGSDGTFGAGELRPISNSKGQFELEQTFYDPSGVQWKQRHESTETEEEIRMKSLNFKDGKWTEDRSYIWKRSK